MTLKTATLIAIVGTVASSVYWSLDIFKLFEWDFRSDEGRSAYTMFRFIGLIISNAPYLMFFITLYNKQKLS